MSHVLIQQYLNQLQDLRKVSGTHRDRLFVKHSKISSKAGRVSTT
jgi:hypothetical protein